MKKLAILAVLVSGMITAQTKKVQDANIHWWGYKVVKTEASSHDGNLKLKEGQIQLKNNKIVGGVFVMDMQSISVTDLEGDAKIGLENHLKNGDFFEVEKYPTAKFQITSVSKGNKKGFNSIIKGKLTVKSKTANISFPANVLVDKSGVSISSDKFSFDRQVFGISYKAAMQDVLIKDEIDLVVKIIAK